MEPREQIEELLPFYALDALTDEERKLVEDYLAEHPEARQQIEEMGWAASALPYGVAPVEPPQHVKDGLLARVAADESARPLPASQPSRRPFRFETLFRTLSLATAAIAIVGVILLSFQVSRLRTEIAALNERLAAQSQSLDQIIQNLPQSNPVITVSLRGTDVQPQAQGQLIANPNEQSAVLVISGLPPLEPGKTYQVWLIGNAPVSAGLLTVDENGQSVLIVTSEEAIGSFNSLGISIEPEGGSTQPTGEIVVLSDL
ncbi:MAG TPA: anti-sigma factor [Anaerolineales bacterium]|nr:anti-sigma factor [Anaerolineales bacterium]